MPETPFFLNPEQEVLIAWISKIRERWPQIKSRDEIDGLLPQAQQISLELLELAGLSRFRVNNLGEFFKLAQQRASKADPELERSKEVFVAVRKATRPSIFRRDHKVTWASKGEPIYSLGPEACARDLNLFSVIAAKAAVWERVKDLPGFGTNIYRPFLNLFDLGVVRIGQKEAGQLRVHFPMREEDRIVLACWDTNEPLIQREHPVTEACSRLELPGMKYLRFP